LNISDLSLVELEAEIKRRKVKKGEVQKPKNELLLRMNSTLVGGIENEIEILNILALSSEYKLNIEKAFLWGVKHKSQEVTKEALRLAKAIIGQQFYEMWQQFNIIHSDDWFDSALFMLNIDAEYGINLILLGLSHSFHEELSFLEQKNNVGYSKRKHITNRNTINRILGMAKDKEPYSRVIRKAILETIRGKQSEGSLSDFQNAKKILRWC
jgi:hypothetical protein